MNLLAYVNLLTPYLWLVFLNIRESDSPDLMEMVSK